MTSLQFPEVGEELGDFCLLAELGRGALGRVFLASQPGLGDRPVVLKVTPLRGGEHRSLARLQHTHVVPLLWVQDLPERGLRLLCLPYHGGVTLEWIWEDLADRPLCRRSGRDVLASLDRAAATSPIALPVVGPARAFLAVASYERSLCWIAFCLAEALHHAHERGLIHLDVKPANILLAADGMPLLLDFHLARPPVSLGEPGLESLGGTPGYMAPEQRRAMDALRGRWPIPAAVDSRADIYALGMLMYEGLAGARHSAVAGVSRQLRRMNPRASVGLADIVARCLEPDPSRRYPDAAALADDLRRHLDDRPLRGVPNRSLPERLRKWRRSRPFALAGAGALAVAALGVAAAGLAFWLAAERRLADAEDELAQGRRHLEAGADHDAARSLRHGMDLIAPGRLPDLPFLGVRKLRRSLSSELARVRRAGLIAELHDLADRVRFLYAAGHPDFTTARGLERRLAEIWRARGVIEGQLGDGGDAGVREGIRGDLLDLAILWADLRVQLASDLGRDGARRDALRTLAEAEADWGRSPVLDLERSSYVLALGRGGEAPPADASPIVVSPRTAWEWYALGRSLLRSGKLDDAAVAYDRAAELQPQGLWTQFYRGQCALRRGRFTEAVDAFGASVALAPGAGVCYFNRGLAYEGLGVHDRARLDLERARRLDPKLAGPAWEAIPRPLNPADPPRREAGPSRDH